MALYAGRNPLDRSIEYLILLLSVRRHRVGPGYPRGPLIMSTDRDDEASRLLEEEGPGPTELESELANDTLSDVAKQAPLVVGAKTSLAEAIRRMQEEHRGCALVVEADKLAGIFTERDVLMRVAGHALDPERTAVSAYMTPDPVTPCRPTRAWRLRSTSWC